jgi:hypothetical protein
MPAGRPRKNGRKSPSQFLRALAIYTAYIDARNRGQKHSVAVREASRIPRFHVSQTEVRRVLADFRPAANPAEVRVDSHIRNDSDIARHHLLMAQVPEWAKTQLRSRPVGDELRPKIGFRLGFEKRTNYPRFNAKPLK